MKTLFITTPWFDAWLSGLKGTNAYIRVMARLQKAELGHFGDCRTINQGIFEMRLHFGPGYRIYVMRRDTTLYLLIGGGDKSSQQRDIDLALSMAREIRERDQWP